MSLTAAGAAVVRLARQATGPRSVVATALLNETHPRSTQGLEGAAVPLLRETLAKGLVASLVRRGGWRRRRRGQLWHRHAPPSLTVTSRAFELLRAVAHDDLRDGPTLELEPEPMALGDALVFYLVADLLFRSGHAAYLRQNAEAFGASTLCAIAFPTEVERTISDDEARRWCAPPHAVVLEGLAMDLADHVRRNEDARRNAPVRRDELTAGLLRGPGALVEAVVRSGAPMAAAFWLEAMRPSFVGDAEPAHRWLGPPASRRTPHDRARAAAAASVVVERTLLFELAAADARAVRHFDDSFDDAQDTLDWLEPWSRGGFSRARRILEELRRTAEEREVEA